MRLNSRSTIFTNQNLKFLSRKSIQTHKLDAVIIKDRLTSMYNSNESPMDEVQRDEQQRRGGDGATVASLLTGVPMSVDQSASTVSSMKLDGTSFDGGGGEGEGGGANYIQSDDWVKIDRMLDGLQAPPQPAEAAPPPVHRRILSTRNPRTALKEYYDEHLVTLTKKHFVTVTDFSQGHHLPHHTSFHVSPKTGEILASGLTDGADPCKKNGFWWYKKSDKAQFAAAGMALDYFHQQEGNHDETFCDEYPPVALTMENLADRGVPVAERNKIAKLHDIFSCKIKVEQA